MTADLAAYERLLFDTLLKLPNVSDVRSNFAFGRSRGRPAPALTSFANVDTGGGGRKHRMSYGGRGSPPLATADSPIPRE